MAKQGKIKVYVQVQGQPGKIAELGGSATVRKALEAVKFTAAEIENAANGGLTVDGEGADLGTRLKNNQMLVVTTKVAGGR